MTLTPTRKAILALAFVTLGLFTYSRIVGRVISDEDRIKSIVRDMADAAEERSARRIIEHLHPDFRAVRLIVEYDIDVMLRGLFLQYKEIRVNLRSLTVNMQDEENAEALFLATVSAAYNPGSHHQNLTGEMARFRLTFAKVDGAWKVLTAESVESTADRVE